MADYDDSKIGSDFLTERERETLPKWAQERLSDERRTAQDAVKNYEAQFDAQKPTSVAYGDVYNNPRYLPDGRFDHIAVRLDGGTEPMRGQWVAFVVKEDGHTGAQYVEVTAGHSLAVIPQAGNVVRVHPFDRGQVFVPEKDEPKA